MDDSANKAALLQEIANLTRETAELRAANGSLNDEKLSFRQHLELPGILFIALDKNGCVQDANKTGLHILGYSRQELLGKNWFTSCLPRKDQVPVYSHYKKLMSGEVAPDDYFENSILHKDGNERIMSWNNTLTRNRAGEILGTFSSGRDITDRLVAEKRLRDAYEIINRSPAVTFLWKNEKDWPVEFVSENVLTLLGYTAAEFTSGGMSYANLIHPEDLEKVSREVATFSADSQFTKIAHAPYRVICKDEQTKWLDDQTSARKDKDGAITHFQGIVLDITEKKLAQEALVHERNELQLALQKVNTLSGMLPICASCKKIRDDKGYWNQIESYIRDHSEAEFTHGICPECSDRLYPELSDQD